MERIGEEVKRELSRFGPAAGLGKLVEQWPEAVGEGIARNAWPARIQRDGTLIVHASSAAWAFELTQLEASIKERLGELAPKRVRFVPGPLPEPTPTLSGEPTVQVPEASPEDAQRAAEIASEIRDEKLRTLVARAALTSLAKARSDRAF